MPWRKPRAVHDPGKVLLDVARSHSYNNGPPPEQLNPAPPRDETRAPRLPTRNARRVQAQLVVNVAKGGRRTATTTSTSPAMSRQRSRCRSRRCWAPGAGGHLADTAREAPRGGPGWPAGAGEDVRADARRCGPVPASPTRPQAWCHLGVGSVCPLLGGGCTYDDQSLEDAVLRELPEKVPGEGGVWRAGDRWRARPAGRGRSFRRVIA